MTTSKAIAGGIAVPATQVAMYFLSLIPFVASMPEGPKDALGILVGSAIGFGLVYFAPKNDQ